LYVTVFCFLLHSLHSVPVWVDVRGVGRGVMGVRTPLSSGLVQIVIDLL